MTRPKLPRTPAPTGHTEAIRAKLAERRQRLGLDPDTVWERLVAELTERRVERGETQDQVAAVLRELEDGMGGEAPQKGSRIQNYEGLVRQPRIDEFAAWARALGMRLHVQLEPADSPRAAIMLRPSTLELAKTLDLLDERKIPAALVIAERLLQMSPGQVRALAEYMTSQADE